MSEPTLHDRFHLIGIGGAGMSVVAELLASRGALVEGSDREDSGVLEHLRAVGVRVFVGHDASHVDPSAVVVVSTAIRESNPELAVARERVQRVIHRSQALALAASGMRFVGVAGAHGKTSTSGMLAIALAQCGLDPSVAVGGVLPQLGTGAHLGTGDIFVAEADESDGSFLNYSPTIEIVTNVEPDHLDRYRSREEFEQIFVEFARCMVPGGLLVTCAEDEGAVRLAAAARAEGLRVVTYGRADRSLCEADVVISDVQVDARSTCAHVEWGDRSADLVMSVPGEHNVLNAAGAWVAGIECGLEPQAVADGLGRFTGAARRLRRVVRSVRVVSLMTTRIIRPRWWLRSVRLVLSPVGERSRLCSSRICTRVRAFLPSVSPMRWPGRIMLCWRGFTVRARIRNPVSIRR